MSRSQPSPGDDTTARTRHYLAAPAGRGCSDFASPRLAQHEPGYDIALWQELALEEGNTYRQNYLFIL